MSAEDETWHRETCPNCGMKIKYGTKLEHLEYQCYHVMNRESSDEYWLEKFKRDYPPNHIYE